MCQCPYFGQSDQPICGGTPSLDQLDYALQHCIGDFKACPVFWLQVRQDKLKKRAVTTPASATAYDRGLTG